MGSDRVFGLGWTALGAGIVAESWRMDRLEAQGINPWTAPGLLPGLLGGVLAVLGLVLLLRRAPSGAGAEEEGKGAEPWRVGLALLLTLGFGIGVLGSGVPFWLAAAGFIFLAILLFEWPERRAAGTLARGAVRAAAVAVIASAIVTLIFQEVFLVRLP